jgi:hypothetical protein
VFDNKCKSIRGGGHPPGKIGRGRLTNPSAGTLKESPGRAIIDSK